MGPRSQNPMWLALKQGSNCVHFTMFVLRQSKDACIDQKMASPSPLILGHASNIAFVHTNHIVMDARWGDLSAREIILTAIFRDRQKKSNDFLAEPETRGLRLCGSLARSIP